VPTTGNMSRVNERNGRVVLLNGPPSCGKTALARALVSASSDPWFHRSLDDFRAGYLDRFWRRDNGVLFEQVMRGYLGALHAMAVEGNDIIAEAVITPDRRALYRTAFDGLPVILVAVRCPLDVAVQRERDRTDRVSGPIALPAEAFAAVHAGLEHDLAVDTALDTPETLAAYLEPQLRTIAADAFARLKLPESG